LGIGNEELGIPGKATAGGAIADPSPRVTCLLTITSQLTSNLGCKWPLQDFFIGQTG
jgi:hypothetical protein